MKRIHASRGVDNHIPPSLSWRLLLRGKLIDNFSVRSIAHVRVASREMTDAHACEEEGEEESYREEFGDPDFSPREGAQSARNDCQFAAPSSPGPSRPQS